MSEQAIAETLADKFEIINQNIANTKIETDRNKQVFENGWYYYIERIIKIVHPRVVIYNDILYCQLIGVLHEPQ